MALEFELVLPCYNEARSLERLIARAAAAAIEANMSSETFQLVLVENGSRDDSAKVMDELQTGALGKWFRKVSVAVNQGYGFGLWTGLQSTTAAVIAWSHADEQCDPKDAFKAFKLLKESAQPYRTLVKGVRRGRNWKDIIVSRIFEAFAWFILGLRVYDLNAQPKVFSRDLLGFMKETPKNFAFDLYVLYSARKASFAFLQIPVLFLPRIHGLSNWAANFTSRRKTVWTMIRYMKGLAATEGRL